MYNQVPYSYSPANQVGLRRSQFCWPATVTVCEAVGWKNSCRECSKSRRL